jgi:hypothetical protein
MGKSTINGPFSTAVLVHQRVLNTSYIMISGRMLIYAWDERQARAGKKRRLAEKHKWGKFRQLHWGAGNSSCRVSWWVEMGISSTHNLIGCENGADLHGFTAIYGGI